MAASSCRPIQAEGPYNISLRTFELALTVRQGRRNRGGAKGAKAPPTLKITQKVRPFSFEVKCPFSLGKRFLNKP